MNDAAEDSTSEKALWFVPYLDESNPWRSRTVMPIKPDGVDLAVRDGKGRITSFETKTAFEDAVNVRSDLRHRRVAIPSYSRWFPAILLWEPREDVGSHPISAVLKPLLLTLLLGWFYLAPPKQLPLPLAHPEIRMLVLLGLMFFGIMPLCSELIRWWEDWRDRAPDRNKRRQTDLVFFDHWIQSFSAVTLKVVVGTFAVVYLFQVFGKSPQMSIEQALAALFLGLGGVMNSVMEAALVRTQVLQHGEWWRLVTAGVMHGSLLHILFNCAALYFLGRVTIAMVGAPLLGVVFLASIVGGSLTSLWLSSGRASVGASGGVMGVLGFLTVILVLHRAGIPRLYKTNLLQAIMIMSIFGALGAKYIDNAAHAGGFFVGSLLGIALVPSGERVWEYRAPSWLRYAGWCSWAVLIAASFHVIQLILDWNLIPV